MVCSNSPLVIIAEDIDNEALSGLVYNRIRSQLQVRYPPEERSLVFPTE